MDNGKAVVEYEGYDVANIEDSAMSIDKLTHQVQLIQQVMEKVMKEGEHYGVIPGTEKPTLYKPGAEKLCLTFRLEPDYEIIREVRDDSFIAYTVKCKLTHIPSGHLIGSGIGSCNTREVKYRYRSENTGREVPKTYWKDRDPEIIGGREFTVRKKDGKWYVYHTVENDNPWDLDNTIIKMACKRALVAVTLNSTAASDLFTQDVEDMDPDTLQGTSGNQKNTPPSKQNPPSEKVSLAKVRSLKPLFVKYGITNERDILTFIQQNIEAKISSLSELTPEQFNLLVGKLKSETTVEQPSSDECPMDALNCKWSGWTDGKCMCGQKNYEEECSYDNSQEQ